MKAYVITTGAIFGLFVVVHIVRVFAEGMHLATDPHFILLTVACAGICLWASSLLWLSRRETESQKPG